MMKTLALQFIAQTKVNVLYFWNAIETLFIAGSLKIKFKHIHDDFRFTCYLMKPQMAKVGWDTASNVTHKVQNNLYSCSQVVIYPFY